MEKFRHEQQLAFVKSKQNIEVGSLDGVGLSLNELKNTTLDSCYVVQHFTSGLTAEVYQLLINGKYWTLKRKRPVSLVNNVDGKTSFLNEVQRRRDLTELQKQNPEDFKNIVETQYASFLDGIILSPWIEGEAITHLNRNLFEQIFNAIVKLELNGLFEWDFCPGNILLDKNNQIKLFDFGYMYSFDPKKHVNSNGLDTPLFHGIERFETRFFFDLLLKNPEKLSDTALFELYKLEKQCALAAYVNKYNRLVLINAEPEVLQRQQQINASWQLALLNDEALKTLFLMEQFRSNILDLLDDLHGQSCTKYTLKKVDLVLQLLNTQFDQLKESDAFFFGDEKLSQVELINKYELLRVDALKFQL